MLNAALGNNATANISFSDVKSNDWYYSAVQKAVAAGYVSGYDNGTFRPTAPINRQEAAVMISRVVPTYNTSVSLTKFKDASAVSSWAKDPMSRIVGCGYITGTGTGTNLKLDPLGKLTRAQAVVIICKLMENETIVKSTTAVTSDATLKNTIYSNGVTIPSNSDKDVIINNSVILGTLNMSGSGTLTLNNSRIADLQVKGSGSTVTAKSETSIKNTTVTGDSALETSSVAGTSMYSAGYETLTVGKNAGVSLDGTFPNLIVSGDDATVEVRSGAKVTKATVSGARAAFKGTGTISLMAANANGITYEKRPSTLTTGKNVTTAPKLVEFNFEIAVNPKDKAEKVAVDTAITLTFNEPVKTYAGETITDKDVDDLFELRANSPSGSPIAASGDVNTRKTQFTLTPDADLEPETTYYVTMAKNRVISPDGAGNEQIITSFTTAPADTDAAETPDSDDDESLVSFSPAHREKNVAPWESPVIAFDEAVICYDGSRVTSDYAEEKIELRLESQDGPLVDFEATVNSSRTKITIVPVDELKPGKRYYLSFDSSTFRLASDEVRLLGETIYFTVSEE